MEHMKHILTFHLVVGMIAGSFAQRPMEPRTITNLYDAFGKPGPMTKDFGFSCIVEYQGHVILFDAGSSADIFQRNCEALGVDLKKVEIAIVSHAHFDHLNGIDYLLKMNPEVRIYFPKDPFWGAPLPFDATGQEPAVADSLAPEMRYFDGAQTQFTILQSGRFWQANMVFVASDMEILDGVRLIATKSPYLGYWSKYPTKSYPPGQFEQEDPGSDARLTELAEISLSLRTDSGDVLIVGCSHSGVENIVADAKKYTGAPIALLAGGFHLLPFDRATTTALANYLKDDLGVRQVAPAHCTGHLAFRVLSKLYGADYRYLGLGTSITY